MGNFGPAFQNADMRDQLDYMKEFNPSFAKADPKTQADYLNEIHYSGARAPTVPSTEPGEKTTPAVGREMALGALGTVAPETEHPMRDLGKSVLSQMAPAELAKTALTGGLYPATKAGIGLGEQLLGAAKEMAPVLGSMVHGGLYGGTNLTPEQQETAAHGLGAGIGMAAPIVIPEALKKAGTATAPWRNAKAERAIQSLLGPDPKNI